MTEPKKHRFLTVEQAAEELNVSPSQIRALLKTGELRAIQVGGRGVWRIGAKDIEDFIAEAYRRTAERIAAGELKDDGDPGAGAGVTPQPVLATRTPPTAPVQGVSPGPGSNRCAKTYPC